MIEMPVSFLKLLAVIGVCWILFCIIFVCLAAAQERDGVLKHYNLPDGDVF